MESEAISIDPTSHEGGGDLVLISHAHSDHVAGFRLRAAKLCSPQTARLYTVYYGGSIAGAVHMEPRFRDDEVEVELRDSGHVLGSSQFRIYHREHGSLVYTGDVNLEGSIISGPGEVLECDELVIDATFGDPRLRFPPREELYEEIVRWVGSVTSSGGTAILYAHPVGKAQELIKLLNEYMGVDPIIDDRVYLATKVYEEAGYRLSYVPLRAREAVKALREGGHVLITPLRVRPKPMGAARPSTAIVTGWAAVFSYSSFDRSFPLTSHSGPNLLAEYVEGSGAKTVYTVGYYAEEMSRWLRRRGFNAKPLAEVGGRKRRLA